MQSYRHSSSTSLSRSIAFVIILTSSNVNADDIATIAQAIKERQAGILQYPNGTEIQFSTRTRAAEENQSSLVVHPNGADGVFRSLWPVWYVREIGDIVTLQASGRTVEKNYVREASHDFDIVLSIAREANLLAQACNFRHMFTSQLPAPIIFQYYVECDELYDMRHPDYETDYWLPNCLVSQPYRFLPIETVDGHSCVVIELPGRDKLWLARNNGYTVLRREVERPERKRRELLVATDLREIAPNLWFPFLQRRSIGNSSDTDWLVHTEVQVTEIVLGKLTPADVVVDIPKDIGEMEDLTRNVSVRRTGPDTFSQLDRSLKDNARNQARRQWRNVGMMGLMGIVLLVANLLVRHVGKNRP